MRPLIQQSIQDETTSFLLRSGEFKTWVSDTNTKAPLWVSGKPGAGKTMLAFDMMEHLQAGYHSIDVPFFHCDKWSEGPLVVSLNLLKQFAQSWSSSAKSQHESYKRWTHLPFGDLASTVLSSDLHSTSLIFFNFVFNVLCEVQASGDNWPSYSEVIKQQENCTTDRGVTWMERVERSKCVRAMIQGSQCSSFRGEVGTMGELVRPEGRWDLARGRGGVSYTDGRVEGIKVRCLDSDNHWTGNTFGSMDA